MKERELKAKMDEIFKIVDAFGVKLNKHELLSISKLRIDVIKSLIGKFAARKKRVTTIEMSVDRSVANSLWRVWKSATEGHIIVKNDQTYTARISGNHLFAIRSCAMKIYQALDKNKGGEEMQSLKEDNKETIEKAKNYIAVIRHSKKEPTLDESVVLKVQGYSMRQFYPDSSRIDEIFDDSETMAFLIKISGPAASVANLQILSRLVDVFGTKYVTLIDLTE